MKKLLMIGAILIMGTMSYAGTHTDLAAAGTGSTSLSLKTTGNVVSAAKKALLVITPTRSVGANGDSLEFNFGTLMPGANATVVGKFEAQVITDHSQNGRIYGILKEGDSNGQGGNIEVGLVQNGNTSSLKETVTVQAKNSSDEDMANLVYTLTPASGVKDSGKTYEGEIESTLIAGIDKVGVFFDRTVSVAVKIANIDLAVEKGQ